MAEQIRLEKSIKQGTAKDVITYIHSFLKECGGYTASPPTRELLFAFQLVQLGFEALSSEMVLNFVDNLQELLGEEESEHFMENKFGSDILAFYSHPKESTRRVMEEDFSILLRALETLT